MFIVLGHYFMMPSIIGLFSFIKWSPYMLIQAQLGYYNSTVILSVASSIVVTVLITAIGYSKSNRYLR
jgi:membrane-anchored protein YejM (alkaline phosphatase superfamily)